MGSEKCFYAKNFFFGGVNGENYKTMYDFYNKQELSAIMKNYIATKKTLTRPSLQHLFL